MSKSTKPSKQKQVLVKDIDFYIEKGMFVFTEKYHRDRGYCCGSGCRHCPYPIEESELKSDGISQ